MRESLLGIDIGGTRIKWARLSADGRRLAEGSLPTPHEGPASVVDTLAGIHARMAAGVGAVGVAVPGHVDRLTGRTTLVPNLHGDWAGYPLGRRLADRLGIRVELINDARAFAAAELAVGSAAGADRALFAVVGTGIGGAIVLDGRLLRNDSDSVGEFGHTTVVQDGERCGCGNRGCAEAYAGVRAMARRYESSEALGPVRGGGRHAIVQQLRVDYDAGDPTARRVLDCAVWATGVAIANVCVALRIPTVVIGGGLGVHWPEFATGTARQLAEREVLLGPCAVLVSTLGDHAGAVGAAASVASRPFGHDISRVQPRRRRDLAHDVDQCRTPHS